MSGGFFRGTSADQDTRFSNKQAKLLKSQKFAPELEHLVDIGKVKMDVMRPWIATRVTELLGFEDEVLINFIYGLLDGKEVNGKQVQISLTGFMEKNTTKFMKELWTLLLSAQSNASGVPQQFLDAKEEETRKKQEEMDRIANEIQKKREKERENRELEQDRLKKMASGVEAKSNDASMESGRLSRQKDDKEYNKINGNRGRYRERSRSISKSSDSRGSISSDRSPRKRSLTPRQRHPSSVSISPRGKRFSSRKSRSPVQRRLHSPYRRRSRSPVRRRSPSPRGRRSPSPRRYRRSPSPRRYRRSPTPTRHQRSPSPVRRRSPSPVRRRSPYSVRRRSPSPSRYRSPRPVQHRSPPTPRRRSPSPSRRRYRRSTTPRRRSPSPVQKRSSIASHRSSSLSHRRSQSPYGSSSPSPVRQQELRRSSASIRGNVRSRESSSPAEADGSGSSDRKLKDQKDIRVRQRSSSSERSPVRSKSPPIRRKRNDRGYISPYESPVRPRRERTNDDRSSSPPRKSKEQYKDNQKMSKEDGTADVIRESGDHRYKSLRKESSYSSSVSKQKYSPRRDDNEDSIEESGRRRTTDVDTNAKRQELKRDKSPPKGVKPEGPLGKKAPTFNGSSSQIERQQGSYRADGRESKNVEDSAKEHGSIDRKADHKNGTDTSGSEETERQKTDHKRKSKQRKSHSHKHDIASNDSYSDDSEYEDRKEAKRRRKEAKKLRKEEKRRKREERRQRRRERRAEKLKSKDQSDSGSSDDEHVERRELHRSDDEGNLSEEKKLEIELRNKALESLKAKKGINH